MQSSNFTLFKELREVRALITSRVCKIPINHSLIWWMNPEKENTSLKWTNTVILIPMTNPIMILYFNLKLLINLWRSISQLNFLTVLGFQKLILPKIPSNNNNYNCNKQHPLILLLTIHLKLKEIQTLAMHSLLSMCNLSTFISLTK